MNNTSIFLRADDDNDNDDFGVAVYIFGMILSFVNFFTNFLILIVFSIRPKLQKNTYNVLVLSLSMADIVVSLSGIVHAATRKLAPQSTYLCRTVTFLFSNGVFMSVYFTFVLSLNRFLSAASATWTQKLYGGKRKYLFLFIPCFCVSFANVAIVLQSEERITFCSVEILFSSNLRIVCAYISGLNIPILFGTIIVYALAIRAINRRFNKVTPQNGVVPDTQTNVPDVRKQRHVTALRTVGILIVIIVIGTAPYLTVFLLIALQTQVNSAIRAISAAGLLITSALNPVFYTWRLKDFRTEIRKIICCWCSPIDDQ